MKAMKKIISAVLSLIIIGTFAGCGSPKSKGNVNSASNIEISYWNSGLGTDWLEAVIAGFEKAHPEYTVSYTANANASAVATSFGVDGDTVDLYLGLKHYATEKLEPLDDVLSATAKGDKKTIGEKFSPSYLDLEKASDGHYYTLTFGGGVLGVVYNKKLFKSSGITQLPRTTNELTTVCDRLNGKNIKPLCHFAPSGYWEFMDEVFFSQYDGFDYYLNNFYACKDTDGTSPSKALFLKKDGRYETIKAYEKFITPEYVLQGSNSLDHVTIQTQFLNGSAAMMVSGSWLSNEMKSIGGLENFEMMKTPVLSAIVDKLTSVKTETELRKLISAIDSITDGEKNLSDYKSGENYTVDGKEITAADWKYVSSARNTVAANYAGDSCYIPSYSNAKDGAKEFLKYLYSHEGYQIYADKLHVAMPLSLSDGTLKTDDWNSYEKNQYDLLNKAEHCVTNYIMSKHPIFIDGGADAFANTEYINLFSATNEKDRITADKAWETIIEKVNDNYENNWLKNIK